jgi:hypothetical protein
MTNGCWSGLSLATSVASSPKSPGATAGLSSSAASGLPRFALQWGQAPWNPQPEIQGVTRDKTNVQ